MNSKFPDGFFWGSATSSYQIEGEIKNDWSEAANGGKVPLAGKACDSYNRYEEDFDVAKELGQNANRLSIEWARIEPKEGEFNEAEIEHYRKVIDALLDRGIEPFVTLWHFTLPVWFAEKGGFENSDSPEIFARYCKYVVEKIGERVKFWLTINEPMVYASNGYLRGKWPPFRKNIFKFINVVDNLIMSHNLAYKKIKGLNPSIQIGIAKNNIYFHSGNVIVYQALSSFLTWFWNLRFLNRISDSVDFIGLNYYFHRRFTHSESRKTKLPASDLGCDIFPEGIFHVLNQLRRYNKTVFITENGIADAEDRRRAKYIVEHLKQVKKSIDAGVDVKGYFYWSLLDNFEWSEGFGPKFGLVEIESGTLARKIKPSARIYEKICRSNSLENE